ncbi:Lipopolysaccharide-assembly, LptC-related [Pseudovibrio axinellae]|uniref:Lipopolysaccharide-assembly, LptC-related n=1 Tax=Pseudovibrio axinellae TaxID=989403 RepID=A0A165YZ62_9HYPH|nr:LPS export ABC transporter periplasmic protein LptC [Pseudovibrio axinellae]KZL19366.1 Lipopolysaccharide-assembly, LptC-related [Pseudovibrio axinellae]SEQ39487.1 lipopolysaccharide export system protein LptC [Pseudovibrio axinellae]
MTTMENMPKEFASEAQTRLEKARKSARRHSLLVRLLRYALPAGGTLIALAVVGMVIFQNVLSGLSIGDISLTTEGLVMSNPHLSGNDGDRSYNVQADRAIQRITNPQVIDLEKIVAEITVAPGETVSIISQNGTFDTEMETLELSNGIQLTYSKGYSAEFEYLDIDMKTGTIQTNDTVDVMSDGGYIDAGSMEFDQKNNVLNFRRGVKMKLLPWALENGQ